MKKIEASFVQQNETLYEQVGQVGAENPSLYVKYEVVSGLVTPVSEVEIGECMYLPPQDDLATKGVVLLPTYPEEYGSTLNLIKEIDQYIYRYVDVSPIFLKIASYYVLLSWVYDCFETIPYIRVRGDFGTGKTRFQKVVGSVCYKPMFTAGATTTSPIFRIIDLYRGTLVLDEGDMRLSDVTVEIVKILNTGYSKGTPVLRTEGDKNRVVKSYSTYGPKIIGTRGKWEDKALESRCLTEVLMGKSREDIPIHLPKTFEQEALNLRNKLLMFRFRHYGTVEVDYSLVIPKIEPRVNQIVLALLSLIESVTEREEVKAFITDYAGQLKASRGQELPAEVLQVMCDMVRGGSDLRTKQIAVELNNKRDIEQGEKAISPALIGRINASDFNFRTRKVNGVTEILWEAELASRLCARYGIEPVEVVDHVAEIQEALPSQPQDPLLEKAPF